ncbi:MAG TPA: alpha/beta fold hydrolase, partial [Solirubrobacteraceae bacterium]
CMPSPDAMYRGGSGAPLVLLHGINASWRVWRPVLGALEAQHEVLALTLPGHRGGPPLNGFDPVSIKALADGVEDMLDAAGIDTAHLVGNSLGGWLAVELGRRGHARSVVVFSPAGGWRDYGDLRRVIRLLSTGRAVLERHEQLKLEGLLRRPRFRRLALRAAMEHGDHIPAGETVDLIEDALGCLAFAGFIAWIQSARPIERWREPAAYPIKIAWPERDRTIPFSRYGRPLLEAIPEAEYVTLGGVGHVPMFDDPPLVARTILEVTRRVDNHRSEPMTNSNDISINGVRGTIFVRRWDTNDPQRIVILVHGIGEHSGRYEHVAERLVADGAVVYAPDHRGHGRSDGERGQVEDVEVLVDDLAKVVALAQGEHPGVPSALLGHSLGGIIATRLVQRGDHDLSALVLTGPAIGGNPAFEGLLAMDPIPDVPIDPAVLSRDPKVGEAYASDPLVYHGPLGRPTLEAILVTAVGAIADGPRLGALPTLWLHGEEDALAPLAPTRAAIEHIRGDQLEEQIYPGARHEILNETNREEVLDEVASFLDGVVPRAAAA